MTSESTIESVNEYYSETYSDYRLVWRTGSHLSMHFGYHDTDSFFRRWFRPTDAVVNVNRVLADKADVGSGDRVLDAGCGVGGSAIWLAQERGAEAVGININDEHLEKARKAARKRDVDGVEFLNRDFVDTGFPDDSFDVVWAIEAVGHADDKSEFVAEAKRVLRPGGRLVVSDGFMGSDPDEFSHQESQRVYKVLEGMGADDIETVDEFRGHLDDYGFENIEFENQYERVLPSSLFLHTASMVAFPFAKLLEVVGIRSETQTDNVVAAYHQYPALKEGLTVHGLFYAENPP